MAFSTRDVERFALGREKIFCFFAKVGTDSSECYRMPCFKDWWSQRERESKMNMEVEENLLAVSCTYNQELPYRSFFFVSASASSPPTPFFAVTASSSSSSSSTSSSSSSSPFSHAAVDTPGSMPPPPPPSNSYHPLSFFFSLARNCFGRGKMHNSGGQFNPNTIFRHIFDHSNGGKNSLKATRKKKLSFHICRHLLRFP